MKKLTVDGNTAASLAAYALSENAAIYPITPSTTMAENIDLWASKGKMNIFGQQVAVTEMQSEAGAAGTLHGLLSAGSLATTFTASQGLLLMIPNMYKIAGEKLPCVIHVAARTIAAHALSIFGDHSDVMACRGTGFAMLCASNVQEAHDFATLAHLTTLEAQIPFIHFFDGFRTSHEIQKIDILENKDFAKLINQKALFDFKQSALNSANPDCRGTAQNPDIFFQNREAGNPFYDNLPAIFQSVCKKFNSLTGRLYAPFTYTGSKNASEAVVIMGSAFETCKAVAQNMGKGVIKVNLFNPFDVKAFLSILPKGIKKLTVLDRTKEPGAVGEPLYQTVSTTILEAKLPITVLGGRYGLGGKDVQPKDMKAVFDNMENAQPQNHFTVGIYDDVTHKSLSVDHSFTLPSKTHSCKFFGFGSDGTVSANKNSIKIIGEHAGQEVQGYFEYDSKKSGSITVSHLRFGKEKIEKPYLIGKADFIACHNESFLTVFDTLDSIRDGGVFLLNTTSAPDTLAKILPAKFKRDAFAKRIKFYIINASSIAYEAGLNNKINLIMQSAFFYLTNLISYADAKKYMKDCARESYGNKGEAVLNMNYQAIDSAEKAIVHIPIPAEWKDTAEGAESMRQQRSIYYDNFIGPIASREGDKLPVSGFDPSGKVPTNTSCLEKRTMASHIPSFILENCIQCGQCSLVCPHGCIRPVLTPIHEKTPTSFAVKPAIGLPGQNHRIQVSPCDCSGCGACASICPAKEKALVMAPIDDLLAQEMQNYAYAQTWEKHTAQQTAHLPLTVKNSQFKKPYFEFSGACAGCGETPYIKLLTQLYGSHMIIANATGCSSIYGANAPTCPYAKDTEGRGPAWSNSLFEDNAEFGFGIYLAYKTRRLKIEASLKELLKETTAAEKKMINEYLENFNSFEKTKTLAPQMIKIASKYTSLAATDIMLEKDALVKQSFWMIGGDGWAYDIGFGGLDHVLASGEDVRILVLDTEVYSNTGGQASKATQIGAIAKFAGLGKAAAKKNLGEMMMTYPNVYVAQVALGANQAQTLKALIEAEQNPGPSIVIAYSTCINQGLNLADGMKQMKLGVETGYINLFRYNPVTETLMLDSEPPTKPLSDFMNKETRFSALKKESQARADELYLKAEANAKRRYQKLSKKSEKNK